MSRDESAGEEIPEASAFTMDIRTLRDLSSSVMAQDTVSMAIQEKRCIKEPIGCGQSLLKEDGSPRWSYFGGQEIAQLYRREWEITGLCPPCQDKAESMADKPAF